MKSYTVDPKIWRSGTVLFGDPEDRGESTMLLGNLAESGAKTSVLFDVSGERVVAAFGKRGSGKSYTLGVLMETLAAGPDSSLGAIACPRAALLLDTLNVFWSLAYPFNDDESSPVRVEGRKLARGAGLGVESMNIRVFVPAGSEAPGVSFEPFSIAYASLGVDDWGALLETDIYSERIGQLLHEVWIKTVEEGWTDGVQHVAPVRDYSVDNLTACLESDPDIEATYASETRRALRQRLGAIRRNPVFQDEGTPMSRLLEAGVVSVLEMNRMSDELRRVTAAVLIRQILNQRARAAEAGKLLQFKPDLTDEERAALEAEVASLPPRTTVAIDEAQNVLPSERQVRSTEAFVKFVREGRNHGLSMFITSQQPTSIDSRMMAQVDTLIIHKLTVRGDLDAVARHLKTNEPRSVKYAARELSFQDLVRSLDRGQALISNTESERHFMVTIRPRVTPHAGVEG